jgi:hypothetical protein
MRVHGNEPSIDRTRSDATVEADRQREARSKAPETSPSTDRIEISSAARELQAGSASAAANGGPALEERPLNASGAEAGMEANAQRLQSIRERIDRGYYETRQVTTALAESMSILLDLAPGRARD